MRILDSESWDYIIPVGVGLVLLLWKDEIVSWWARSYTPSSPTCIPIVKLAAEADWTAAAVMFAVIAVLAYLTITGQDRLLRAVRIAAFLAIVLDLLIGVHVTSQPTRLLPEGLVHAVNQFAGWMLTVGLGGLLVLLFLVLGIGSLAGQTHHWQWRSFLVMLDAFAFLELAWVSTAVKRWSDVSDLAILGAAASIGEAIVIRARYAEGGGGLLALLTYAGGVVWFAWVGTTGYQMFLAAWGPRLC